MHAQGAGALIDTQARVGKIFTENCGAAFVDGADIPVIDGLAIVR